MSDDTTLFDLGIGTTIASFDDDSDTVLGQKTDPDGYTVTEPERFSLRTGRFRGTDDGEFNDGTAADYDGRADRFRREDGAFATTPEAPRRETPTGFAFTIIKEED